MRVTSVACYWAPFSVSLGGISLSVEEIKGGWGPERQFAKEVRQPGSGRPKQQQQ